jgi:hypothetical protein
MEIKFTSATSIEEIQHQFTSFFPHLKLGFFKDLNLDQILTANELVRNDQLKLSELSEKIVSGTMEFDPLKTILDFEESILLNYGLQVQVFRKSGNSWLVTTATDSKTFAEQEAMALEMNRSIEKAEPYDYQEHE